MLYPNKKAFIVDVDGTLYNQHKLRRAMFFKMVGYYAIHFWKIKELLGIFLFRKYRYKYKSASNDGIIDMIADYLHMSQDRLRNVRYYWMDIAPLSVMPKYKYDNLLDWLTVHNAKIYIYSDYEPTKKLNVLQLQYEKAFFPDGKTITSVKPDINVISYIINEISIPKEQILYIGDDDTKDGESAKLVGIDYINIKELFQYLHIEGGDSYENK
jgi:HAD superfamily hydrolase (TIGR01549 family)